MSEQNDTYAIVILGGMNPRIHHPAWYQLVGLIDNDEAEQATKLPSIVLTQFMAQFDTPELVIVCQDNRWEIRTSNAAKIERIKFIASKLFDEVLPHTPISAAGFNFTYKRQARKQDVGKVLADVVIGSPLGLKPDHQVAAELILRRAFDDHTAMVSIQPIAGEADSVVLFFNFEYTFKAEGAFKSFKLADTITGRHEIDKLESEEQAAQVLEAINRGA